MSAFSNQTPPVSAPMRRSGLLDDDVGDVARGQRRRQRRCHPRQSPHPIGVALGGGAGAPFGFEQGRARDRLGNLGGDGPGQPQLVLDPGDAFGATAETRLPSKRLRCQQREAPALTLPASAGG